MVRFAAAFAVAMFATLSVAAPARADVPKQVYEHGPDAGSFSLEYNGQVGDGDPFARPHSLEAFAGVSDRLASGIEIEGEVEEGNLHVVEFALGTLLGLTDAEAPVALSILLQVGTNRHGDFPQAQARLIAEHKTSLWTFNGNLIVRRQEGEEDGSALAFAATAHRNIAHGIARGVEMSGQVARVSGSPSGFDAAQYTGPSLAFELDPERGPEVEIGFKYLHRIDTGNSSRDTLRLVFGMEF